MKKLFIVVVILVSCMMSSMSFATPNYYAFANVYIVDNNYTPGNIYDVQIGVLTEYPSWTGFVYEVTGYLPSYNSFTIPGQNVTMPGPIPYNTQTTDYYKVVVQVTKHIWLTKYSFSTGMGLCR